MKKHPYTKELIASKFWQTKSLSEMNKREWEAICDGCGRCCLHKLIDEGDDNDNESDAIENADSVTTEEVVFTNVSCYLLNTKTCSCSKYEQRFELVHDCVNLDKNNIGQINFMPSSCSYRRLNENKGLAHWHPLLNQGKKSKMHQLGITVRNKVISEADVDLEQLEDYIVLWPQEDIEE